MSDLDETATLLNVFEKTTAHGTMLEYIRAAALKRLQQINEEHAPEEVKKAKADKEKEAREKAAAQGKEAAGMSEGRDDASKRKAT